MTNTDVREQKAKHLVVLVHGINTEAYWIDRVKPTLEDAGFIVAPTSYGNYSILRFLLPFRGLRQKAINRVARAINMAEQLYKPDEISVISHSFGTYVAARILAENPIKWNRIIFCGSVLKDTFPLYNYVDRFNVPLLNEVGSRDYWPALAESVGWGYGSIGSKGLHDPAVSTRWHHGYRHSDFLNETFTKKFWIPFLKDGTIVHADQPTLLPFSIRALTSFPLRLFVPLVLAALVIFAAAGLIARPSNDCDVAAPPELPTTRVTKFEISPRTTAGSTSRREWTRVLHDRWLEKYVDDGIDVNFHVKCRTTLEGCPGTVVYRETDKSFRAFIPDKGCNGMPFMIRTGKDGWGLVGKLTPTE
jgi:pimeloyl-ACP methyl ester carboxylesterase